MSDERFGWARSDGCVGLTQALRRFRDRASRKPTNDDRPTPSVLPMTPAARAALALSRHLPSRGG